VYEGYEKKRIGLKCNGSIRYRRGIFSIYRGRLLTEQKKKSELYNSSTIFAEVIFFSRCHCSSS